MGSIFCHFATKRWTQPIQFNDLKTFPKVPTSETRAKNPNKIVCIVSKLITPQHFMEYATPKFFDFVMHNHVARWHARLVV